MPMSHSATSLPPLYSSLPQINRNKSKIFCGQCDHVEASMKCVECAELYCANCFAYIHLRGALKRHQGRTLITTKPSPSPRKGTLFSRSIGIRESNGDKLSAITESNSSLRPLIKKKIKLKEPIPKLKTAERLPKLRKRELSPIQPVIITSDDKTMQINPKHFAVLINIHHSYNETERSNTSNSNPIRSPSTVEKPVVTHESISETVVSPSPAALTSENLRTVLERQTSAELQASLDAFIDPYPLGRYSPFNFKHPAQTLKHVDLSSPRDAGFFTDLLPSKTNPPSRLTMDTDGSMTIPLNDENQSRSSNETQPTQITPIRLDRSNKNSTSTSSSRSTTPTKLTEEWVGFDSDDDGCSSRACQNRHDEEYFQQLYDEFHSKQNVAE